MAPGLERVDALSILVSESIAPPTKALQPNHLPQIHVAVGVMERDGRYLLSRRVPGTHLEGLWEFPGGKVRPGETTCDAVARELREEVDIQVGSARLLHMDEYRYTDRVVALYFFLCARWSSEPRGLEGQELRWFTPQELRDADVPPANRRFLELLLEHA